MTKPMTPSDLRQKLEDLDGRAVCRDGMSPDSYEELEEAESVEDLKNILLEVFEPSKKHQSSEDSSSS